MPFFDYKCRQCGVVQEILFLGSEEQRVLCCNREMKKLPSAFSTPEWGGPKFDHAAQQQFGSRSEQQSYWKQNGFREAGDKVGGARNEDNLNLGKRIVSDPKVRTRRSSSLS